MDCGKSIATPYRHAPPSCAGALRLGERNGRGNPACRSPAPRAHPDPLAHGMAPGARLSGTGRRRRCRAARHRQRHAGDPLRPQADRRQGLLARGGHHRDRPLVPLSAAGRAGAGRRHRLPVLFRVVAGRARGRRHPPESAGQPAAPAAQLLRNQQPPGNLLAHDVGHGDHRTGGRHHGFGGAAQRDHGAGRHDLPVRAGAEADRRGDHRHPARGPADRVVRPARAPPFRGRARTASPRSA